MNPKPTQPQPSADARLDDVVDRSLREAEVLQRNGYPYIVHPLMDGVPRAKPELLQAWVDWALQQRDLIDQATLLMAPEAMGLPLVAPLSLATGKPYVVVRKRSYDRPGEEVAYCETGYGEACLHVNDAWPDDKVLLIDDVLSTGSTLGALGATLQQMRVPVVGALVFLDKGHGRDKTASRIGAPLRAMRTVTLAGGKVHVRHGDGAKSP